MDYLRNKYCCCCNSQLTKVNKTCLRKVNTIELLEKLKSVRISILTKERKPINDNDMKTDDMVCGKCRSYANKYGNTSVPNLNARTYTSIASTSTQIASTSTSIQRTGDTMKLNIPRTIKSKTQCVVCHKTKNLVNIPESAYVETFISNNVMIPDGAVCCKEHLNRKNKLHKKDMDKIEIVCDNIELTGTEVDVVLTRLRHLTTLTTLEKFANERKLNENDCLSYTGLNKEQFATLLNSLNSLRNSSARNKSQALGTYLFWLKTGLDNRTIATIFSLDNHQSVSEYHEQVRKSLMIDFVPKNLGAQHLTREQWAQQTTITAKKFFTVSDDQTVFIADGTYIYTHKSKYNTSQRKAYSGHMKRALVKPFVVCTTTGKIVDIFGLFPASDNDAKIVSTILKSTEPDCAEFKKLLKPNDHFIFDRGFLDCLPELQTKYKFKTHTPAFKKPKQKQLSTLDANSSRFVTRVRWVVEAINGRLKTKYRANDKTHFNVTLPHLMEDLKISASLMNKFFSNYGENEEFIADKMLANKDKPNRLEKDLEDTHVDKKRTIWRKMDASSVPDFPKLDFNTIVDEITHGKYQLKQSLSYIHENFDSDGNKCIEILDDKANIYDSDTILLRTRIQSRHSNSTLYNTYITYSKKDQSINDIFCSCPAGARTVGTCSHAASVIYYLGNARYESTRKGKYTIESVFPVHTLRDSSEEDNDETEIDSDNTEIEEQPTNTLYPDLTGLHNN